MFGLDDHIAALGAGELFLVVALVAILLGLRHATDPDHIAAVSTLVASDEPDPRRAGRLGFTWGMGHATSLFVFGVPIVLFKSYLPGTLQTAAEAAVGILIIALAVRLLVRRPHQRRRARTGLQAYGIGLLHGMGGSGARTEEAGPGRGTSARWTSQAEPLDRPRRTHQDSSGRDHFGS